MRLQLLTWQIAIVYRLYTVWSWHLHWIIVLVCYHCTEHYSFRKIFICRWRENLKTLLFCWNTLPVHQRGILFYKSLNNALLSAVAKLYRFEILSVVIKYQSVKEHSMTVFCQYCCFSLSEVYFCTFLFFIITLSSLYVIVCCYDVITNK